jgi:hypothetical protein
MGKLTHFCLSPVCGKVSNVTACHFFLIVVVCLY